MRRGFGGLTSIVEHTLLEYPFSDHVFVLRGRGGDRIKIWWWSGEGLCLLAKRLEHGYLVWPTADSGAMHLTTVQLLMNRPGFRGGCLVKVKQRVRQYCRVDCSSLPLLRPAGYSRWLSAGVDG